MTPPKTTKDFLVLAAIAGGIIFPAIGFALFFTGRGNPVVFTFIGIAAALMLGILFWFGLGLAGILRVIGKALIPSGAVCLLTKPLAGLVILLIGFASYFTGTRMQESIHQNGSGKNTSQLSE